VRDERAIVDLVVVDDHIPAGQVELEVEAERAVGLGHHRL
jgi:hypothetical protein